MMAWETIEHIIAATQKVDCRLVDITGGAPELHPDLPRFIEVLDGMGIPVMVRTNLTVLLEPDMDFWPAFFRDHHVQLVASLPCYLEDNVDRQRGKGVFKGSVEAIQILNRMQCLPSSFHDKAQVPCRLQE